MGIADDPELLRRIDEWPHNKRQPLLMLAAARFLGAQISPYRDFRAFLDSHWADVSRTVLSRATQTNEAGRCATLLPSLAQIAAAGGRPLALIEVGASAGLNLFPDRYGYEYDAGARVTRLAPAGAPPGSYPVLGCAVTGPVPLPAELPPVVWRAGIDLNPLDVRNPDDVAWLEALIWPEQDFRRERLRRAIAVAQADPPLLVAGDLNDRLLALAAQAPPDATLVVFHSAVMAYLDAEARDRFRAAMARLAVEPAATGSPTRGTWSSSRPMAPAWSRKWMTNGSAAASCCFTTAIRWRSPARTARAWSGCEPVPSRGAWPVLRLLLDALARGNGAAEARRLGRDRSQILMVMA